MATETKREGNLEADTASDRLEKSRVLRRGEAKP